jgi:hypothetical protein
VTDERIEVPLSGAVLPPELLEALARGVAGAFAPPPVPPAAEEGPDFLTAGQLAARLGVSRETVRRLAIADVLPCTVVCRGSRKTTRRLCCMIRHAYPYLEMPEPAWHPGLRRIHCLEMSSVGMLISLHRQRGELYGTR